MKMKNLYAALGLIALFAAFAVMNILDPHVAVGGGLITATTVAVQSTYSENIKRALAGMSGDERNWDAITRNCETSAGIGFGLAVSRGADKEHGCILGGSVILFLGVSKRDVTLEISQADKYIENQSVGIQTAGSIWVTVTGNPDPSDPVHFDTSTGAFAASGGAGPLIGARWMTETTPEGLCLVNLPAFNQAAA